jgi:hypothetical protein
MNIPWKYKVVCGCGCGDTITGYGDLRNIYNSIRDKSLRSIPYPYFGFLFRYVLGLIKKP